MNVSRRRGFVSWFVDPYKQVKLGLMFLVLNLLFAALIFIVFGYYVLDIYTAVSSYFHLTTDQNYTTMSKFAMPVITGSALIIAFVIATILISVKYTHQIYGPLVSIHRFLDQILDGQRPDKLSLRQSDQLQDLAKKLNLVAEGLAFEKQTPSLMPIYKFLDSLIEGKPTAKLALRENDQLDMLVEKLNTLNDSLKKG